MASRRKTTPGNSLAKDAPFLRIVQHLIKVVGTNWQVCCEPFFQFLSYSHQPQPIRISKLNSHRTPKQRFLAEAPDGWRRFGQAMQRCSIKRLSRWIDNDNKTTSQSSSETHWLGPTQAISKAIFDDGDVWINCRREDYAFWVSRLSEETTWKLQHIAKSSDMATSHRIMRGLHRSFYPDFLFRQDSLLDAIAKPYFELISVEREPTTAHPNLFKVVFNYEHPFRKSDNDYHYNFVQKGNLWLDADNNWLTIRLQAELLAKERTYVEINYEFDTEFFRGIRLPVRRRDFDLDASWQKVKSDEYYEVEYSRIDPNDLDPNTMALSFYGFAEPALERTETQIEIRLESDIKLPANAQSTVVFSLKNITSDPLEIVRVAAC